MMKRNGKRRVLSLLLCAAMLLSLVPVLTVAGDPAEAKTSLPGIEAMKAGATLNILEIAPSADQGSIGYYIAGQEPCRNWLSVASGKSGADRLSYVNDLFNGLASAGLLSSDDTKPLKAVYSSGTGTNKYYDEKYPWDSPTGYTKMTLASPDSVSVKGSYTEQANGGYNLVSGFTLVANDSGTYNQKIAYYTTGTTGSEQYYYDPTFTKIEANAIDDVASGTPVYTNSDTGRTLDYKQYVYVGTVGPSFILHYDPNTTYYTVTNPGTPAQTKTDTHYYVGVVDSYVAVTAGTAGYFNPAAPVLQYVGDNSGAYSFTAGGTGSVTIKTSTVWYKGGFTNNDWFLRYVFDCDKDAEITAAKTNITFKVTTETPAQVTTDQVSSAGLIVLGRGLKNDSGKVTTTGYTNEAFQSNVVTTAILNAVKKDKANDAVYGKPVIVDYQLYIAKPTENTPSALATALIDYAKTGKSFTDNPTSWVGGSVYVYSPDSTRPALATSAFATPFDATLYNTSSARFGEVYDDITYENFLRTSKGQSGSALLSEAVSMAACVRYIINYNQKRHSGVKTSIRVLDVEPVMSTTDKTTDTSHLTKATVTDWTGLDASNITIDSMSSSELIGKIDDLSEKYDLIYIGAKTTNKTNPLNSANARYKYANIGATVIASNEHGWGISGLLDRDYTTDGKQINANDTSRTFRYSGNDLTEPKYDELKAYVDAGYPVVIDDGLISTAGKPAVVETKYTVNITSTAASTVGKYPTLTATPVAVTGGASLPSGETYQWYKGNNIISNATSASYKPTADGTYYCTVSYSNNTVATSQRITVTTTTTTALTVTPDTYSSADGGYAYYYYNYLGWKYYNYYYYTTSSNWNPDTSELSVTAIKDISKYSAYDYVSDDAYLYQWYKNGSKNGQPTSTLTITSPGSYRCLVYLPKNTQLYYYNNGNDYYVYSDGYKYAYSQTYVATQTTTTTYTASDPAGTATTATIPASDKVDYVISTSAVDNCSIMYRFLKYAVKRVNSGVSQNVMQVSNLASSTLKTTLRRYVNLSKPSIVFDSSAAVKGKQAAGKPLVYDQATAAAGTCSCGGELTYTFYISNPTDPNVSNTAYTCSLYLDLNADGKYTADELINDTEITDSSGTAVKNGSLKVGHKYTVTRSVAKQGIIPWKLQVTSTGSSAIHASAQDYAYNKPTSTPTTINILQLRSDNGGLDLEAETTEGGSANHSSVTNKNYSGYYGQLFADVSYDFNVNIVSVKAGDISQLSSTLSNYDNNKLPAYLTAHKLTANSRISDVFNSFDMLVLGFNDCYKELSMDSVAALKTYIASGKPVLFTHDNMSYYSVYDNKESRFEQTQYYTINSDDEKYSGYAMYKWDSSYPPFGYYFTMAMRDTVGLDRYGVVNAKYGYSKYERGVIPKATDWTGFVASKNYPTINYSAGNTNYATYKALLAANYSIAFQPGSATAYDDATGNISAAKTVGETQGISNPFLYNNSSGGNRDVYAVSEENKGQITTYPYNVNTSSFGGTNDSIAVGHTHYQYQQLNLNAADTVVWYCLKGDIYEPNDASNNYYIYTKGNVTYSGAGHAYAENVSSKDNPDEAKLFVNTMIAAYRVAKVNPENTFTTEDKSTVTADYVVPTDGTAALTATDQKIWFTVTDNNVGSGRITHVIFTKGDAQTPAVEFPSESGTTSIPVYDADGKPVTTIVTGNYYVLLKDLQSDLSLTGGETVKLQVKTTFTDGSDAKSSAQQPLTIHNFNLFDLN